MEKIFKSEFLKGLAVAITIVVGGVTLYSLYHRIQIDKIALAKLKGEKK